MRDVVDVAGQRLREAVHLVDERRDEERAQRGQRRASVSSTVIAVAAPRRFTPWRWNQSTAGLRASVRKTAIRIHVDDVPRDPDDLEQERDRDRDPEHRKDRRGPEPDEALLHARGRITAASDGS